MKILLIYCDVASPARYLRFLEVGTYHQVLQDARMEVASLLVQDWHGPSTVTDAYGRERYDLVCVYLDEFNGHASLQRAAELRAVDPDTPLCAFGIFPTLGPDQLTSSGLFSYVLVGEGEFALYELATQLQNGGELTGIRNLMWSERGNWNRNTLRPLLEHLDHLPFAERSLFGQDLQAVPPSELALAVNASRGCMYGCQFCYSPVLKRSYEGKGAYYRVRSPQHVAGEILAELNRGRWASVMFVDEQFPMDRAWLRGLRQRLGAGTVRFQATTSIERCDPETLDLLKEAGCESIVLGIETGNEGFRKRISDRNVGNDQVLRFAGLMQERGMRLITTNMSGLPLESEPLLNETYALNQQLELEKFVQLHTCPFLGRPLRPMQRTKVI